MATTATKEKIKKMLRNKKATLSDIVYILLVVALVFTVGTIIVFKISDELTTKFEENTLINNTPRATTAMNSLNDMYPGVIDNSFMLLIIGLAIAALAFASFVKIHPVFFVFFIIILVIVIFLAGVFSNVYQKIADNDEMSYLADQLTYMSYIMKFLPFIVGVLGISISIVMYKTWQNT